MIKSEDIPIMLREMYKLSKFYENDSRSPTKLKHRLDTINSTIMQLWLAVVKKQEWGAVSESEIMECKHD